ncbi:MAG: class I SAM-dependent methyltransferase [Limnobacter sp.]|nr:class I SAM-dependent methyltransferase [Limnobacter sp.]
MKSAVALLFRSIFEALGNLTWYCRNWQLFKVGLLTLAHYFLLNPYRVCREYMVYFSENQVQKIYGETAFATLATLSTLAGLSSKDTVYDLGCGRGLGVFWWASVIGCKSVGIDLVPTFIRQANAIKKQAGIQHVEFMHHSIFETDLSDATFIYLYGTAFSEHAVHRLVEQFRALPAGVLIASISYPLSAYAQAHEYTLLHEVEVGFLWGKTTAYLQRKNG